MVIAFLGYMVVSAGFAQPIRSVAVNVDQVFLPQGYDDNDSVQLVVDGAFPDACYQLGVLRRVPEQEQSEDEIVVEQQAYVQTDAMCADVMVPFTNSLVLGALPSRNYRVRLIRSRGGPKDLGRLSVAHTTTTAFDDHLYLPLTSAEVSIAEQGGQRVMQLRMKGTYTNSCMALDRVEFPATAQLNPAAPVVDILPILSVSTTGCASVRKPFDIQVTRPLPNVEGRVLFHFRSLNGQAVHVVEDVSTY